MRYLVLIMIIVSLYGCAAAVVGAGASIAASAVDRRTTGTFIEDQAIELKAKKLFYSHESFNDQVHISVTSYNGIVLLTGEAPTEALRKQAEDFVNQIEKVRSVYNEVIIAAPSSILARTNDSAITGKVKTNMLANLKLEGLNIKIVTSNNIVYLMGLVSKEEAELAADIASATGGVQKVVKIFEYSD